MKDEREYEGGPVQYALPAEPGVAGFVCGSVIGAVLLPPATAGLARLPLPPGIRDTGQGIVLFILALVGVSAIGTACLVLGRRMRRQMRKPRFRYVPRGVYAAAGFVLPLLFLGLTVFPAIATRVVGLHWGVAVLGPFLLGAFTAPRPRMPEPTGSDSPPQDS